MLLIARMNFPEAPLHFWDKFLYIFTMTIPFYASCLGVPHLLRKRKFVLFCLCTITLFGVFLGMQYLIGYVYFSYLSPGKEAIAFKLDFFFADFTYVFGLYYLLGLGYWFAKDRILKEKALRLAEQQNNLAVQEALRSELALKVSELAFLKVQFNPHFLYNTLNYLYSKAIPLSEELADGIMKLSDIMRYALKESPDSRVTLSEEIYHLHQLIDLHQARFNHKLHVSMQVEGDLEQKRILPLVLISFVENAFKHGNLTNEADPLLIHLSTIDRQIVFTIQNKKNRNNKPSTHIGNQNVQRRLKLSYADNHQLQIKEDEHYYRCELIIQDESLLS